MKKWICLMSLVAATRVFAGAVPSQITYQGTLKEGGVPVNASRNMQFQITDAGGTQVYWSSGNMSVNVAQGLFSVVLSPTGVDWQNITPYITVSVEGQPLSPSEPITSTAYALECGSVADGSVLSGMIAMFAGTCPAGWTRFTALDGRFPMGGASYGATGGSATTSTGNGVVFSSGQGSGSFWSDWKRADNGNPGSPASILPPYLTVVFCQKQ